MKTHKNYGSVLSSTDSFGINGSSFSSEVYADVSNIISKNRKIIPIVIVVKTVLVAMGLAYAYLYAYSGGLASAVVDSTCIECPNFATHPNCTDRNYPVLGGVDFVQYFEFQNESMTGLAGSENISTLYKGFSFYFLSEFNKQLFEETPEKYIPQYGGKNFTCFRI